MRAIARSTLGAFLLLPFAASAAIAGPTNPDITVIGDTRLLWSETTDDVALDFEELEVAFVGAVSPYASAEVFIGVHELERFEVEEAKLLLDRYLPAGLGLTIGRYLQDFGQLNPVHGHAYPFIHRPLMHQEFFGEDGALDTGVRLDWIAPLDAVTLRATAGVVKGDVLAGGHGHGAEEAAEAGEESTAAGLGASGRVEVFAEPSRDFSFLVGGSILHGEYDPVEKAQATWLDIDVKARLDLGPGRALVLNAEGVFGSLDATGENPEADPQGWFVSADLRANRRWNLGGFAESTTQRLDDEVSTRRYGAFVGHALMEESTVFRLVVHVTDREGTSEAGLILQALFALGPHRPHRY